MSKEKNKTHFIMTTVIGGVIFLVPLVVLGVVLVKAASVMMIIAEPMAEMFPVDSIGGVALANIIALLVVLLFCFLAGLVARHALASAFVTKLESSVLVNVPGYMMIKNLVSGFDPGQAEGLKPVLLKLGTAERIGFEVQKLEDGRSMVFLPSSPNPFSGVTQVLPPDQIVYLDVPVNRVIEVTENFGHGFEKLVDSQNQASKS